VKFSFLAKLVPSMPNLQAVGPILGWAGLGAAYGTATYYGARAIHSMDPRVSYKKAKLLDELRQNGEITLNSKDSDLLKEAVSGVAR
jgi:hypothetical protein